MLTSGMTLGPYEIESRIGAGGMGVVYRARDTRLGRERPAIGGVSPFFLPITPEGTSYAWGYEIQLNDLYTISVGC